MRRGIRKLSVSAAFCREGKLMLRPRRLGILLRVIETWLGKKRSWRENG